MAKRIDGKRVSTKWWVVLRMAQRDGVRFLLTSGKRTMAEQTALFFQNMRRVGTRWVPKTGRPLTAWPSPNAPHIRVGRSNHALDVNTLDGGEFRLERWIEAQGAHIEWTNPVFGEPWHGEVEADDLTRLYRRFAPLLDLKDDELRWVREFDRLKATGRDPDRRRVLKRVMTERRQRIWRSAEGRFEGVKKGWDRENRRARYAILNKRT